MNISATIYSLLNFIIKSIPRTSIHGTAMRRGSKDKWEKKIMIVALQILPDGACTGCPFCFSAARVIRFVLNVCHYL